MKFVCLLVALLLASQSFASQQQSSCAVCELVVQVAENYIARNATLAQIQAKAMALCNDLPSPYNKACDALVTKSLPQIVAWIQNNEPPHTICAQLQFCPSTVVKAKRDVEQSPCAVCELVVQVVETYLTNNATAQQIQAKLDAVCNDLPSPYNGECILIVKAYLPQMIQWIQNNESPATLCAQLSLCSSKAAVAQREVAQSTCAMCELVVQVAENYVLSNTTIAVFKYELVAACSALPSVMRPECDEFVAAYVPQLFQYIKNHESPATFCKQMKICRAAAAMLPIKKVASAQSCMICQMVYQMGEVYINDNVTAAELQAKLQGVCKQIAGSFQTECINFVNYYLPQLIQYARSHESPEIFCKAIDMCPADVLPRERAVTQDACSTCQLLTQMVVTYINNNATIDKIKNELVAVCDSLSAPFDRQCVLLVNSYLPQLVLYIQNNESPALFCKQIQMCPQTDKAIASN